MIIEVTKNQKRASEVSTTVGLLVENILITTSRQATRMFFPQAFLAHLVGQIKTTEDKKKCCAFFNTTSSGGFYTYKFNCGLAWTLNRPITEEAAG